jgi:hypothetical protein
MEVHDEKISHRNREREIEREGEREGGIKRAILTLIAPYNQVRVTYPFFAYFDKVLFKSRNVLRRNFNLPLPLTSLTAFKRISD